MRSPGGTTRTERLRYRRQGLDEEVLDKTSTHLNERMLGMFNFAGDFLAHIVPKTELGVAGRIDSATFFRSMPQLWDARRV